MTNTIMPIFVSIKKNKRKNNKTKNIKTKIFIGEVIVKIIKN